MITPHNFTKTVKNRLTSTKRRWCHRLKAYLLNRSRVTLASCEVRLITWRTSLKLSRLYCSRWLIKQLKVSSAKRIWNSIVRINFNYLKGEVNITILVVSISPRVIIVASQLQSLNQPINCLFLMKTLI